MKKTIAWVKDWFIFGKDQGFWFSFKYKTGLAKEGKDFYSSENDFSE